MIFISMHFDERLLRTVACQLQTLPSGTVTRRSNDRDVNHLPPIYSIRHLDGGMVMTEPQIRARRLYNMGVEDEDSSSPPGTEFTTRPPAVQVILERSDDDDDDD